jgi:hypothetical protein
MTGDVFGLPSRQTTATDQYDPEAEVPRGKWGWYKLPDPHDTSKDTLHRRVTSLVHAIDETYTLDRWNERVAVGGMVLNPTLLATYASLWPDHAANRGEMDELISQAKLAAGSKDRAMLGTYVHKLTECADAGLDPVIPEDYAPEVEAWKRLRDELGLRTVHIERQVVNDEIEHAGTFDRIDELTRPLTFGRLELPAGMRVVSDLKTGRSVELGWLAHAAQLTSYARSARMWVKGTRQYEPMPPRLSREWAILIHVAVRDDLTAPAVAKAHLVDLTLGAKVLAACLTAWQLNKRASTDRLHLEGASVEVSPTDAALTSRAVGTGVEVERPVLSTDTQPGIFGTTTAMPAWLDRAPRTDPCGACSGCTSGVECQMMMGLTDQRCGATHPAGIADPCRRPAGHVAPEIHVGLTSKWPAETAPVQTVATEIVTEPSGAVSATVIAGEVVSDPDWQSHPCGMEHPELDWGPCSRVGTHVMHRSDSGRKWPVADLTDGTECPVCRRKASGGSITHANTCEDKPTRVRGGAPRKAAPGFQAEVGQAPAAQFSPDAYRSAPTAQQAAMVDAAFGPAQQQYADPFVLPSPARSEPSIEDQIRATTCLRDLSRLFQQYADVWTPELTAIGHDHRRNNFGRNV